ncbi:hypothetical protein L596_016083 [Steinernema carpocapsae]|uniref:Uncharacterized protein n=1 Tax=Steinernema carpocapsae TaxID=34508 RepID=A0A4U5NHJ3_STECR|nr:hypothetical protein L596_016083 [Steinernema carpocapsae]
MMQVATELTFITWNCKNKLDNRFLHDLKRVTRTFCCLERRGFDLDLVNIGFNVLRKIGSLVPQMKVFDPDESFSLRLSDSVQLQGIFKLLRRMTALS